VTAPADARPHIDAILAVLTAAGVTAYDAEAPADAPEKYAVVYPDPGTPSGTLGDRHRHLLLEFQLTAVGRSREQAQWVADKARAVLLTTIPTVPGRVVQPLWQVGSPPPVQRDDDVQPPLYYQPVSYQMRSTTP
jgi:hypothetical protein